MGPSDVSTTAIRPPRNAKPGHLAPLDDVDPERARGPGEAPGDGIVTGRAGPSLVQGAKHRQVAVEIDEGDAGLHLFRGQKLGVDAVQMDGVSAAPDLVHLVLGVGEEHEPALGEHEVEVELLREPFPKTHGVLVEGARFVPEVVRPNHGRVASRVAAPDPALLEHRDTGDAVLLRKVVRGRESVSATADHDNVVTGLRRGISPRSPPATMGPER